MSTHCRARANLALMVHMSFCRWFRRLGDGAAHRAL